MLNPSTVREALLELLSQDVQITTNFGMITGTVSQVKDDYTVITEVTNAQVLVPIDKIELLSEV
ncbi:MULTISPECIES: DUF2642 domain-containing protein [Virgibacillus]|uniref:DUF2642 domain-containing protein n=1 Tax=Virgibacillus dokdonensis TaxID=302167 RepID=A0ABU7VER9_9BACI|nr:MULTISPECIES: DUF2642 domain-containing protein [Virgibacillus]NWO12527.1 DUF2642 domain-containing protein [Virgibacillus sp.]